MLRARDDRKEGGFIYHSVVVRLAKIVRGVQGCEDIAEALEKANFNLHAHAIPAEDGGPDWTPHVAKELDDTLTGNCLDRTGYFLPRSAGYLLDPWKKSKQEALESALPDFKQLASSESGLRLQTLQDAVLGSLWGNRNDLSLSAGVVEGTHAAGRLLVDDTARVLATLSSSSSDVIIILDNCGAELLADLLLAWHLLSSSTSTISKVTLHCKAHPVFVSDAMVSDVLWHVQALQGTWLGQQLHNMLATNRLCLLADEFYCSPVEYAKAPDALKTAYAAAGLVIVKGDANYRRLFGDRALPPDFSFEEVARRITPTTPLLAVRTCKSPVIVGITRKQFDDETKRDPAWCVNGTVGVIQLV